MTPAANITVGAHVRVMAGDKAGSEGTVTDTDSESALGFDGMVRVEILGEIPPRWWIDAAHLLAIQ